MIFLFLFLTNLYQPMDHMSFHPALQAYCDQLTGEFDQIPSDRRETLQELVTYLQHKVDQRQPIQLNFICTHNSRRSQFGQVWAKIASIYYQIPKVNTYSGGTEVTSCNPRTIAALQRAGVQVGPQNKNQDSNPKYRVRLPGTRSSLTLFSKVYHDQANPQRKFCAIPVCSSADAACPLVVGAEKRIYHGYEDPKKDDGTSFESKSYDETCRLIARELFYVFSQVKP